MNSEPLDPQYGALRQKRKRSWAGSVLTGCAALVIAMVFAGCASPQQYVHFPDQSKRVEDPQKGRIYVIRPSSTARSVSMVVKDGRKTIGCTGPNSFLCWEREPGKTTVTGTAEFPSSVDISVENGNVYFVFQHLAMGLMTSGDKLELVSEEKGRKILKKCNPPNLK
jgi:hypothetical protein